ncbi:MAG: hypothetical protein M5U28_45425 [Sandaracinaceae bacterium]|nr:hypothetical protein [Sandaracinaceae bacterium]
MTLAWFARFLERRREDDLRAAHYYLRAARAEPDRARRWAAVVRFLLARGLVEEARASLRRWLDARARTTETRRWSRRASTGSSTSRRASGGVLRAAQALLAEEADVGSWDPEPHLAHVRASGRADARWVERLASVIRERMTRG